MIFSSGLLRQLEKPTVELPPILHLEWTSPGYAELGMAGGTPVAAYMNSRHNRVIMEGSEEATVLAPLGFGHAAKVLGATAKVVNALENFGTAFSGLLLTADRAADTAQASSKTRSQSAATRAQFRRQQGPIIRGVDPRCRQ